MSITTYIFVGTLVGWFASAMATNADLRALLNILVAIAGAVLAGLLLRLVGGGALDPLVLAVSAVGAVGLLLMLRPWVRS